MFNKNKMKLIHLSTWHSHFFHCKLYDPPFLLFFKVGVGIQLGLQNPKTTSKAINQRRFMLQICQKLGRICWVEMRKCSLSLLGSRIELMVISVSLSVSNSPVSAWKELLKLICPNRLFFSFQSCSPNNPPRANVRP